MSDLLKGGTATVTGAASGIGRATAIAFARDGCSNLALGDLSLPGLQETKVLIAKAYPQASVEIYVLDITNEEGVSEFFEKTVAKFGRLDFAANVAGYAQKSNRITETSQAEYDKSYAVNQRGSFFCERAQLRQMLKQEPLPGFESAGSIVNVTSLCATVAIPGLPAYSASKGGLWGMSKVDAQDYGPAKIRVNCVAPGNTFTPMLAGAMGEGHGEHYASITPLKRLGRPEDIANAIVWLSSPRAAYITGISLPVDGGLNLRTGPP